MAAVSNTSPLNYLLQIDLPELLPALFGQIMVPRTVLKELTVEAAPEKVRAWCVRPPPWLTARDVKEAHERTLLRLHPGERDAIVLAQSLGVTLLIDERAGREEAKGRGIRVAGTLRILDEAAERGLADFSAALSALQSTTFYVAPSLLQPLLERDRRRKKARGGES